MLNISILATRLLTYISVFCSKSVNLKLLSSLLIYYLWKPPYRFCYWFSNACFSLTIYKINQYICMHIYVRLFLHKWVTIYYFITYASKHIYAKQTMFLDLEISYNENMYRNVCKTWYANGVRNGDWGADNNEKKSKKRQALI